MNQKFVFKLSPFRDIDGYPNYQVNGNGIVRNRVTGRFLKQVSEYTPNGLLHRCHVSLYNSGVSKTIKVHQLVAKAFPDRIVKPNINGLEIDHIDRNPINNRWTNLRWITHKENINNRSNSRLLRSQ